MMDLEKIFLLYVGLFGISAMKMFFTTKFHSSWTPSKVKQYCLTFLQQNII